MYTYTIFKLNNYWKLFFNPKLSISEAHIAVALEIKTRDNSWPCHVLKLMLFFHFIFPRSLSRSRYVVSKKRDVVYFKVTYSRGGKLLKILIGNCISWLVLDSKPFAMKQLSGNTDIIR